MSVTISVISIKNDTQISKELWDSCIKLVPERDKLRINKYRFWKDRQSCLLGKLLIANVLGKLYENKSLDDIKYTRYKKPYIEADLSFNVSHSGGYVVCAWVQSENSLGIDIEKISENLEIDNFNSVLTSFEKEMINESDFPSKTFYNIWTLKESVCKADGRGLNIPLEKIEIHNNHILVENKKWYYHSLFIAEGYICNLAIDNENSNIITQEIILKELF